MLRLAIGTLTVLPVSPPERVDRRTGARAMVLAPLVGLLLGGFAAALLGLLDGRPTPLLAAVLVVGLLAALTRGIHLDGLADTADALGSARPPDQALAVMRRGDVGPFGVATLALTLLVQVAALAALLDEGNGTTALVGGLVLSRLTLPMLCSHGVPAARADGLGSTVAGSVTPGGLMVSVLLVVASVAVVLLMVLAVGSTPVDPRALLVAGAAAGAGLAVAGALGRRCVRRLGGVTGDVLGAGVETSFTVYLVVLALA